MRDFNEWFSHFRKSISDYAYYVDFDKVHRKVDKLKPKI
ncbi:MAG: type II restriction endonuclease [Clostridiales Family XIII bacterium]|nr:type II restriction endonuclease [Clostridiales Family XIII bacterium]